MRRGWTPGQGWTPRRGWTPRAGLDPEGGRPPRAAGPRGLPDRRALPGREALPGTRGTVPALAGRCRTPRPNAAGHDVAMDAAARPRIEIHPGDRAERRPRCPRPRAAPTFLPQAGNNVVVDAPFTARVGIRLAPRRGRSAILRPRPPRQPVPALARTPAPPRTFVRPRPPGPGRNPAPSRTLPQPQPWPRTLGLTPPTPAPGPGPDSRRDSLDPCPMAPPAWLHPRRIVPYRSVSMQHRVSLRSPYWGIPTTGK